ncbi:MAG: hypothetical protein WCO56_28640 [Verrucomicrobiota bacterium]
MRRFPVLCRAKEGEQDASPECVEDGFFLDWNPCEFKAFVRPEGKAVGEVRGFVHIVMQRIIGGRAGNWKLILPVKQPMFLSQDPEI